MQRRAPGGEGSPFRNAARLGGVALFLLVVGFVSASAPAGPLSPPTPGPTRGAGGGDPFAVPFGSRPLSGAISLVDCRDVVIADRTFRDLGPGVIAIRLERCTNVTIEAIDLVSVAQGVYAIDSANITVRDSRYRDITGPAQPRTGANVANFVQFNRVAGGLVARNVGTGGDTEDIVSVYDSDDVIVEDNRFEGTSWTSRSGSGIALGDGGSSRGIARRNVLLNPGQAGIFIGGGIDNAIIDNVVIGEPRPGSNVGIYVWNQSESVCSGSVVTGNRVSWVREDGASNPYWDGAGCGEVALAGNDFRAPLDPDAYRVRP